MNDQTLQALTAFAAKLGTTAEYLWGVLLSQAPIQVVINVVFILALFLILVAGTIWVRFQTLPDPSDRYHTRGGWDRDIVPPVWGMVAFIWFVFGFIPTSIMLPEAITALMNPEFWALQQILNTSSN